MSYKSYSQVDASYTKEYTRSYEWHIVHLKHKGLQAFRTIRDRNRFLLDQKIEAQLQKWDEQWMKLEHKSNLLSEKEAHQNLAEQQNEDAKEIMDEVITILSSSLTKNHVFDWETLKNYSEFPKSNLQFLCAKEMEKIAEPPQVNLTSLPLKPLERDYQPQFSFWDSLIKSRSSMKIENAQMRYNEDVSYWEKQVRAIKLQNERLQEEYQKQLKSIQQQKAEIKDRYILLEHEWRDNKNAYDSDKENFNSKIDVLRDQYKNGDSEAILEYCTAVLNSSEYPDTFPKQFDLDYNEENKLLIIEYKLPTQDDIPKVSEVKYLITKKEIKETTLSEAQHSKLYETTLYNICLRTLNEIFSSDKPAFIDSVVLNGWVHHTDKATGKQSDICILSVHAQREKFVAIDLNNVDPKLCFKGLKGVGSSKLSVITPIQPIVQLNKNDKRFVEGYEVSGKIDEGYNLAIMDWEDFEHLIRELFEKEFSSSNSEVKVTQASRDGGVDAVVFDPDPIKGGKIIIQSKRYTNTVGVSAVRDLYGTVLNEGASKGILVTTSDYGPDAYEFAKNKPLTLLNGGHLLYLLEKHGQKARINIAEAKKILSEQQSASK